MSFDIEEVEQGLVDQLTDSGDALVWVKGLFEGLLTIDAVAERFAEQGQIFSELSERGWVLEAPVDNGYIFLNNELLLDSFDEDYDFEPFEDDDDDDDEGESEWLL